MASKKRETYDPAATNAAEDAFLKENGDDLVEVDRTEDFDASREVLERLIREEVGDDVLVQAIAKCANQQELFTHLVRMRKGTRCWCRFVQTVLLMPEEVWENWNGDLSEDLVPQLMADGADFLARVAKPKNDAHRQIKANLTTSYHPLYCTVDFGPYWKSRTEHFIRSGDAWRAWDMIRQAHRGFFIADREAEAKEVRDYEAFRQDPANRCCRASVDMLRMLVSQLFEAMVKQGVITSLEESDYRAPVDTYTKTVWEGPVGRKRRRVAIVENVYPCKALVLAVGGTYAETRRGKHRVRGSVRNPKAVDRKFHELSAEANKIAQHFHGKKQEKRPAKRKSA